MTAEKDTKTSRERLVMTLNHKEPDRIPIDFGGTAVTGIHASCVAALRNYFGLEERPVRIHEPFQMLGTVDDDLRKAMGLDVVGVFARTTMFGFPTDKWKSWRFNGIDVLVPGDFNVTTDVNGDTLIYPEGDTSVAPSGRMPRGGYFFDCIVRQEPFDEDNLNPEDNLEEFKPISRDDLDHLVRATQNAAETELGVIASIGGTALGDIALVPGPFLKHPKGIRDVTEWYVSTSSRQDYIHKVFERQCEIAIENLARVQKAIEDRIQAVFLCGTDFGTQTSAFCSVRTFQNLYLPYYKQLCGWIHSHTSWKVFKHSCGAVSKFLPYFIEAGIDILNPVQCSATGMDPEQLKANFGDDLIFWGGGVDTQRVLPFGTPDEVREQVLRRCEIFSRGGGFVFNTIHNVQAETPVENIVAMLDAVHEFNGAQ
ncbi:MAG: uroporphyrinogen decarboxylase family protein [Terracidiphilus sp.]